MKIMFIFTINVYIRVTSSPVLVDGAGFSLCLSVCDADGLGSKPVGGPFGNFIFHPVLCD